MGLFHAKHDRPQVNRPPEEALAIAYADGETVDPVGDILEPVNLSTILITPRESFGRKSYQTMWTS